MMLAKGNTPRHAARSTHVILVTNKRRTLQWPAQSMDLNPSKHVWDILKRNVLAQPLQPNLRELTRVTHQMYNSTTASSQIHYIMGEQCTVLELPQQVDIQWIETKLNTTYIDIAVFVFRVSMLILSVKCVPIIKFCFTY